MTSYKITIKDNSIPEHMQKAMPNFHDTYTAIIETPILSSFGMISPMFINRIDKYIGDMATELDTDPESLEILSIIKQ